MRPVLVLLLFAWLAGAAPASAQSPGQDVIAACTGDGAANNPSPDCAAACEQGHADSCMRYAMGRSQARSESGEFVLARSDLMRELDHACELGSATACILLLDRSHVRYAPVFVRAEDGSRRLNHETEAWWPRFEASEAERLVERICELDADACVRSSRFRMNRSVLPRNYHEARRLVQSGCERGSGSACFGLAQTYYSPYAVPERELDPELAVRYLRLGCNLSDALSCARLAIHFEAGLGVEIDAVESDRIWLRACTLVGIGYCQGLRDQVEVSSNWFLSPEEADAFYRRLEND